MDDIIYDALYCYDLFYCCSIEQCDKTEFMHLVNSSCLIEASDRLSSS